jgi:hypothetical protein
VSSVELPLPGRPHRRGGGAGGPRGLQPLARRGRYAAPPAPPAGRGRHADRRTVRLSRPVVQPSMPGSGTDPARRQAICSRCRSGPARQVLTVSRAPREFATLARHHSSIAQLAEQPAVNR